MLQCGPAARERPSTRQGAPAALPLLQRLLAGIIVLADCNKDQDMQTGNDLPLTLCMWSRFASAQYSCVSGDSRVSHKAAVAAWHPCATTLPSGQSSSVHRSRRSTTYCSSGSSGLPPAAAAAAAGCPFAAAAMMRACDERQMRPTAAVRSWDGWCAAGERRQIGRAAVGTLTRQAQEQDAAASVRSMKCAADAA